MPRKATCRCGHPDCPHPAPVVEPNPVCGARVDYHGGTCGRPVGHDSNCAPVVEPEPACEGCPDPGLPCAGCPAVEPEPCRYPQPDGTRCTRPGEPKHGMCGPHYWARDDEGHAPHVEPERMPCGHSRAAIVSSGEGTSYCGECVEACSPDDYETGPEPKECPRCHVPWFGVCRACGIDMRKPGQSHPVREEVADIPVESRGYSRTGMDQPNPVEPGCDGHCAPDECVCPGLAKLAVLAERARIVAIIVDALECDEPNHPCEPHADPCCGPCNWRPVILAMIDGGPTDG